MKQTNKDTKQFTTIALLVAVTIVLQTVSATLLKFFAVPVSLVMIPIAVAVIMYGVKGGAIVGGAFGLTVFIHGVTGLDAMTASLMTNPAIGEVTAIRVIYTIAVTFVRCLLAGVVAGFIYKLLSNIKKTNIKYGLTGLVTTICNTGLFIIIYLMLFYNEIIEQSASAGHANDWFTYFLLTVVAFNFIFEAITTSLLTPPICKALNKIKQK